MVNIESRSNVLQKYFRKFTAVSPFRFSPDNDVNFARLGEVFLRRRCPNNRTCLFYSGYRMWCQLYDEWGIRGMALPYKSGEIGNMLSPSSFQIPGADVPEPKTI